MTKKRLLTMVQIYITCVTNPDHDQEEAPEMHGPARGTCVANPAHDQVEAPDQGPDLQYLCNQS
jgi:hypothetical protein